MHPLVTPIPECGDCAYRAWPAPCAHAADGIRRKCELVHGLGRPDYAVGLDRAMCGVPEPSPGPASPDAPATKPCCGQAEAAPLPPTARP